MKTLCQALLLLFCCHLSATPVHSNELPMLGDPAAALMSADQEYRLGRAWLRNLRGQVSIMTDPLVQEYVESLVYTLASYSHLEEPNLTVVVVNNRTINAFAVPGGVIGLNAGLFLSAGSEDEVAGVIAHEIAHVSQRHFARRFIDSRRMNTAMLAAILASLAVAIAGEGEAGMAGIAATQAGAIQSQLAYSRHNEREADRVGMQTLAAAGMDPQAMPTFFERMHRNRQFSGTPPEFLLTHPVTEERIADSRARARNLPRPGQRDSRHFDLIQARIQAAFISDKEEALSFFQRQQGRNQAHQQQAARYGLAMSHLRLENHSEALDLMQQLQQQDPDQLWFILGLAEVEMARGNYADAAEHAQRVLAISPRNYAASLLLSRIHLRNQEPQHALPLLRQLLNQRSDDPLIWDLSADAYGNSGDQARALHARAEGAFLRGRNRQALQQLRFALREADEDFALHSRLSHRLTQMEKLTDEKF